MNPKPATDRPIPELPASALYSSAALGRLWKKVHLACSPFLHRPAVRLLYQQPAPAILKKLTGPYSLIALGCAGGDKESLLLGELPDPSHLLAADTNLTLALQAARRLPGLRKSSLRIDLTSPLPPSLDRLPRPRLFSLFGVLPNLDPLPLLHRISGSMKQGDMLVFSANLSPGPAGPSGALPLLAQYDNAPTRRWLKAAVRRSRFLSPQGRLEFGIFHDPRQRNLARIEARWISKGGTVVVFSSRRPTAPQVEAWIRRARLQRLSRHHDPLGEEAVWLVRKKT